MDWKETLYKIVESVTEDKLLAMLCLTALGYWTITNYPIEQGLPVITSITGGICGFVAGLRNK